MASKMICYNVATKIGPRTPPTKKHPPRLFIQNRLSSNFPPKTCYKQFPRRLFINKNIYIKIDRVKTFSETFYKKSAPRLLINIFKPDQYFLFFEFNPLNFQKKLSKMGGRGAWGEEKVKTRPGTGSGHGISWCANEQRVSVATASRPARVQTYSTVSIGFLSAPTLLSYLIHTPEEDPGIHLILTK